jgi:hypothetical protein
MLEQPDNTTATAAARRELANFIVFPYQMVTQTRLPPKGGSM